MTTIVFEADITANLNLNRIVNVNLNGHTLNGNVTWTDSNDSGSILLENGTVTGNLNVNTPNASFNGSGTTLYSPTSHGMTVNGTETIVALGVNTVFQTVAASVNQPVTIPYLPQGLSTLSGSGSSAEDANDSTGVSFYSVTGFSGVSDSFSVTPISSYLGNNSMWVNNSTGYDARGGYYTPNGLTFYTATFTLQTAQQVTVSMPTADDIAMAYIDGVPTVYRDGWTYNWSAGAGITMPSSTATIDLSAGTHTIVVEAANVYSVASSNQAGVTLTVRDASGTIIDTSAANMSQWTSTGYTTSLPPLTFSASGTYVVTQVELNPHTETLARTAVTTIEVQ